ncbi:hypothetical protein, partial [Pseudonocardia lacus]|uniref:hypothetical protein n=1 Tax=Pseudonocardia lacus TaxID=2835865 RepID=UPI001BDD4146
APRERPPTDTDGWAAARIAWDETTARAVPATAAARPRPRLRWIALVLGAVLALVAVGLAVWTPSAGTPPAVDPSSPEQVAQRYRALGADLVRAVLRCSALTPDPGETERVSCDFGGLTVQLVGYDSTGRLRAHRDAALAPGQDSARSASTTGAGAAFAMDEAVGGGSTVYWDVESPRPVSATVTAARPLAEVLDFYDERRSTAVQRPEMPGAAFASPALWDLASTVVDGGRGQCEPTARDKYFSGVVEQVACTFPNGVLGDFGRFVDSRAVTFYRTSTASADYTVPGTVRTGSWNDFDDPADSQAQLIEYVLAADGDSYLYYDRRETLCFGLLYHPDHSQDRLKEFFVSQGLEQ